MLVLQNIVGFIVLLGGLVTVHELGHFWAAKLLGVKVVKFSIGFGPKLWGFRYGETEYVLAWIPLGGFVRMAGAASASPGGAAPSPAALAVEATSPEEASPKEEAPEEEALRFLAQPWWKRGTIALAGPLFSILFPVLVFFVVYWGHSEVPVPRIGSVVPDLPAAQAGLLPGDWLTKIDGRPIQSFSDISSAVQKRWDTDIAVEYQRDGLVHSTRLRPKRQETATPLGKKTHGLIGVSSQVRPAVLGIREGSAAQEAGLKTFDRVVELNGEAIRDEAALFKALKRAPSPLQLRLLRAPEGEEKAPQRPPEEVMLTLPKQEGEGYAALGALPADLCLAEVLADSPASKAGLRRGDCLLAWNGEPLSSWEALAQKLRGLEGTPFQLAWLSADGKHEATLAQEQKEMLGELKHRIQVWELGLRSPAHSARWSAVAPETHRVKTGFWQAWAKALEVVPKVTLQTAEGIAKLLTGRVSSENVGGPVMIFQATALSAQDGVDSYLSLMALLSINFALLNLLPVPVLDGFAVLAALWEGIRRKPLPLRFREITGLVGLVLLALLMGYALTNDIARLLR